MNDENRLEVDRVFGSCWSSLSKTWLTLWADKEQARTSSPEEWIWCSLIHIASTYRLDVWRARSAFRQLGTRKVPIWECPTSRWERSHDEGNSWQRGHAQTAGCGLVSQVRSLKTTVHIVISKRSDRICTSRRHWSMCRGCSSVSSTFP